MILSEHEPWAVGTPKENGTILVFMNDGDVINVTSHSWFIWREAEQTDAHLNPVMDDLVVLRRMLFPKNQGGIVPDEDTALQTTHPLIVVAGTLALRLTDGRVILSVYFRVTGSQSNRRRSDLN